MSMRWDPLLAAATARELSRTLHRGRVRALLLDSEARRVMLFLRDHTLILELHPLRGWLSLLPPLEPLPGARPLPVQVKSVDALPDESALVFALPRVRGKDEGVELIAEMVGNRWNAVVVGHRSRIIRHVLLPRKEENRSLTVGAPYVVPRSTGRIGVDRDLDREEWTEWVEGDASDPDTRRRSILRRIAWTSSVNVGALLGPDGWEHWMRMTDPQGWGAFVLDRGGGAQPYPVRPEGMDGIEHPTLMSAFDAGRQSDETTGSAKELLAPSALLERGEKRHRRALGKVAALERELERTRDPGDLRSIGDLILARFAEVPEGVERVMLLGFEGNEVEVELDPTLSTHENAERYYDEAARVARAREQLPERIRAAREEGERWAHLLSQVREGRAPAQELADALGPTSRSPGGPGRQGSTSLPYRTFTSSGGLEIRVGRGARRNDDLTFRHSDPSDIWLHTRQAAGAHVILRWHRDETPPARDLAEAATLAALYSEARHSGSVAVDWTWRKHVRKPRKSPPGAVVPERVRTVFVEPDPSLADRLSPDGPQD